MGKVVKIRIEASSKDPYARYHGVSIDEDLQPAFWKTQPEKIAGTRRGYFRWEEEIELPVGRHYVVYGVSSPCRDPYYWNAVIYINDKEVARSSKVCGGNYLEAYFTVPFLPVINRVVSRVSKFSVLGLFKMLAGGKILKGSTKKREG